MKQFFIFLGIGSIKTQLKEDVDKARREKTVIVGDLKPIVESLSETALKGDLQSIVSDNDNKNHNKNSQETSSGEVKSRKERRAINLERENAKSIQKQSIRTKKT